MLYNYSVSLIRKVDNDWTVYPEDPSLQAFYYELLSKNPGDSYLATKTQGDLCYCVFLSGQVCHTDIYGWIITLNGYQITHLKDKLHLFQEVWAQVAHTTTKVKHEHLHQWVYSQLEKSALVSRSSPVPIDRRREDSYLVVPFEPPRPTPKAIRPKSTKSTQQLDTKADRGKRVEFGGDAPLIYLKECLTEHYFDFSGRARRREFWGSVACSFFFGLAFFPFILYNSMLPRDIMTIDFILFPFFITLALLVSPFLDHFVLEMLFEGTIDPELLSITESPLFHSIKFVMHDLNCSFSWREVLCLIFLVALSIPLLSVTVRRLHDTGRSGWRLLLSLVPLGGLLIVYWLCRDGSPDDNKYGRSPKYMYVKDDLLSQILRKYSR